jgi:hypothetical protein
LNKKVEALEKKYGTGQFNVCNMPGACKLAEPNKGCGTLMKGVCTPPAANPSAGKASTDPKVAEVKKAVASGVAARFRSVFPPHHRRSKVLAAIEARIASLEHHKWA